MYCVCVCVCVCVYIYIYIYIYAVLLPPGVNPIAINKYISIMKTVLTKPE